MSGSAYGGCDRRRLELVPFLHVHHDLVQGLVLGDEEVENLALVPAPIQGWGCLVIGGHCDGPAAEGQD